MHQNWGKLLFLHWSVPVAVLRPMIPRALEIDTYDGGAWVSITPFTIWGIRPAMLPAVRRKAVPRADSPRAVVAAGGR